MKTIKINQIEDIRSEQEGNQIERDLEGKYFIEPFNISNSISNDTNNQISLGTDDKLFVPEPNLGSITSTGLEAIDEGNGIGWRLIGKDPLNYGNIGQNAVDLSMSASSSSTRGATGGWSFAIGSNTRATNFYSFASGDSTLASGNGAFTSGYITKAIGNNSFAANDSTEANGDNSSAFGSGNISNGDSEFSIGKYNEEGESGDTLTSRLFNVGNGIDALNKSSAFSIFKNGASKFHPLAKSSITNASAGMLIANSENYNALEYYDGTSWIVIAGGI